MITINYIGTIDYDYLNDPNKADLMKDITESIMEKIESSQFVFSNFSCSNNKNLPEGKVIFQAVIDLIPQGQGEELYFDPINEN